MNRSLKPIVEIFSLNNNLYTKAFEKLDDDASHKQFDPETYNAIWLLCHLASTRYMIFGLIKSKQDIPWEGMFNRNIQEVDPLKFPPLAEIKNTWSDISDKFIAALTELDEAALNAESPSPLPTSENSILAALAFLAQHESYHIGQLSYVRRLLKQDGLFKLHFSA